MVHVDTWDPTTESMTLVLQLASYIYYVHFAYDMCFFLICTVGVLNKSFRLFSPRKPFIKLSGFTLNYQHSNYEIILPHSYYTLTYLLYRFQYHSFTSFPKKKEQQFSQSSIMTVLILILFSHDKGNYIISYFI